MASSFTNNALQININFVLGITDKAEMVLYKRELEQFFDTAMVKHGDITCEVSGKVLVISEDGFVGVFGLPTEGLVNLSEVPKDLVYDSRSIFSQSGEPISTYGKKRLMKYEFRLLNDILAKSITVKAGSFDAVTHERFLMMTAIHFGIQVNWSKILFGVLKEMVDKTLKKAKGFAAQICVLLKSDPIVTMGEATTFPPLKILSAKTSKKRPIATGDEPAVTTKKRTSKRKGSYSKDNMDIVFVAQEAIPLQTFEPSTAVPGDDEHVEKRAAVEEAVGKKSDEPTADTIEKETVSTADEVDSVIAQVLAETTQMEETETTEREQPLGTAISIDLTEAFAQLRASVEQIHFEQIRRKDDADKLRYILLMHIRDLENQFSGRFDEQDRAYRAFLNNIRKDIHDQKTLLSLDVFTSQQKLSTQVTAVALDNTDIRKEVKEQRAILTDLDGQVATVRSELLDFRAKAEENHLNLSTQLVFLVDYINRGGDAKKGEGGSSSRPQPPPDDQSRPSGGNGSRADDQSRLGRGSFSREGGSRGSGSDRRRDGRSGSKRRRSDSGGGESRVESGIRGITYGPYLPPKRGAKWLLFGEKLF
ncbi:hypothetical protein F511_37133 [Dorcoceras hygrometricum]|uniref:Dystroglycan-like n=1 Tax=Dorcoceras hygrometricum TaxID=472368 RepID=A0A2Z7A7T5_9LAMI|nr:hypothetical protein F511_37133 [Dorcoceras hygrometricum]